MRAFILALCVSFLSVFSVSVASPQVTDAKFKKVEVGMSVTEVKSILGRPKAVEAGFAQSWDSSEPDMTGQLNYTSWFYPSALSQQKSYTEYRLNGRKVTEELYTELSGHDTLVFDPDNQVVRNGLPACFVDGDIDKPKVFHTSIDCEVLKFAMINHPVVLTWEEAHRRQLRQCQICPTYKVETKDLTTTGQFKISYVLSKVFVVVFERGTSLVTSKTEHESVSDAQETRLKPR